MARDKEGVWVAPASIANGPCSFRMIAHLGQCSITHCLTERDPLHRLHDGDLEGSSCDWEWQNDPLRIRCEPFYECGIIANIGKNIAELQRAQLHGHFRPFTEFRYRGIQ